MTCRIEVRNATGGILMTLPLRPKVHRHESRDIAVLHSPDDAFMIDELDQVRTRSWLEHWAKRNFPTVIHSADARVPASEQSSEPTAQDFNEGGKH